MLRHFPTDTMLIFPSTRCRMCTDGPDERNQPLKLWDFQQLGQHRTSQHVIVSTDSVNWRGGGTWVCIGDGPNGMSHAVQLLKWGTCLLNFCPKLTSAPETNLLKRCLLRSPGHLRLALR